MIAYALLHVALYNTLSLVMRSPPELLRSYNQSKAHTEDQVFLPHRVTLKDKFSLWDEHFLKEPYRK